MRSNSKHTARELERYILLYLDEGKGFRELSEEYSLLLSESTFGQKVLRYQEYGLSGIQTKSKNNHYTKALKKAVIREHLEEGMICLGSLFYWTTGRGHKKTPNIESSTFGVSFF